MHYPFKVVAFGLSAGGLSPLSIILKMLPKELAAAFVIVPHLYPHQRSRLDEILERTVERPVHRIQAGLELQSGCIYTLPEGKLLAVKEGRFTLQPRPEDEKVNKAIDHFFISLAEDARDQAIGIILSGGGGDGIKGAMAIEDQKGIVIAQDPITAEFPYLPQGLIANDHPDYVLTPEEIVHKLIQKCDAS